MRPMSGWTPPTEFDEFRLLTPLGRGGMSQVFTAQDVFLDRLVAVKFLLTADTDGAALERLRIEARAIARLQHPNVVVVHRTGEAAGYPYLVSELLRGQTLAEMSLAWLLHDGKVTSVLTGASKPQQILDNIGALKNTHFSDEELKLIDEISAR